MLLEYLKENYQKNEPIFVSDIDLPVSDTNLRQMFKVLCDKGEIKRYDTGIYYMQGMSRLKGGTGISASEVARYKYVERNKQVIGYYTGYTFANQLGLTTQVPFTIEIVSNQASAKCREVSVRNQKIMLRRPRTEVTKANYLVLQLLDLVKDMEQYIDADMEQAVNLIFEYVKKLGITRSEVDQYIGLFPERIYKNIYETRLYNAFA
jgi:predicted transcriptional regulator of viral defense system